MDGSDGFVLEQIARLGSLPFVGWLAGTELARSAVSVLDAASRGDIAYKILPRMRLDQPFLVEQAGEADYFSKSNYERYQATINAVNAVNPQRVVEVFTFLEPMLNKAYAELGAPMVNSRTALKAALDHVLSLTVQEADNLELARPVVNYQFADPAMENMTDVQKQLVRMGPDNARALQQQVARIRAQL